MRGDNYLRVPLLPIVNLYLRGANYMRVLLLPIVN